MAVKIRLRRMGARNRPFYRVVVADSRSPNSGRFIENIGYYDPMKAAGTAVLKFDRFEYWKGVGAIPTNNVKTLAKRAVPYEKTIAKSDEAAAGVEAEEEAVAVEAPAAAEAPAEQAPADEASAEE